MIFFKKWSLFWPYKNATIVILKRFRKKLAWVFPYEGLPCEISLNSIRGHIFCPKKLPLFEEFTVIQAFKFIYIRLHSLKEMWVLRVRLDLALPVWRVFLRFWYRSLPSGRFWSLCHFKSIRNFSSSSCWFQRSARN